MEGWKYVKVFFNLTLAGGKVQIHAPAALLPAKEHPVSTEI
jgi:hypothetical protein